jgi:FtsP/CotA-like multicopper oxidase with cupredoxin domain
MARAGFSNPAAVPAQYRDASGGDVRETLTSLFFHDHRPDFTAANVYRGLIGLFRLYDERDTGNESDASPQAWRLPSGPYDVPLLIADRRFDPQTGELFFDQFDLDGHLGDKYTVNGRVQPYFEVKRRKYRFRVYTPGPTRIYHLVFRHNGANQPFTQLSNSGNLLEAPRQNLTRIEMVPANRVDLIVDFRRFPAGAKVHLANILPTVASPSAASG